MEGSYPLWRHLYLYVNMSPNNPSHPPTPGAPGRAPSPLDPIVKEFLKFVYSKEGQQVAVKDGFFPLSAAMVDKELKKLE